MSHNLKNNLPKPRFYVNEQIYDHHVEIFDTMVTNSDLIVTIKEVGALDFVDQDPCHLWESNLAKSVCPCTLYFPEIVCCCSS